MINEKQEERRRERERERERERGKERGRKREGERSIGKGAANRVCKYISPELVGNILSHLSERTKL